MCVLFHSMGLASMLMSAILNGMNVPQPIPLAPFIISHDNRQYGLVLLQEGVNHFTDLNSISEM